MLYNVIKFYLCDIAAIGLEMMFILNAGEGQGGALRVGH